MHLWFPHFLTNRKIADQVGNDRRRTDGSDTNAIQRYIFDVPGYDTSMGAIQMRYIETVYFRCTSRQYIDGSDAQFGRILTVGLSDF